MIIVDFSAIAVASFMTMTGNGNKNSAIVKYQNNILDVDIYRHMVLESLGRINRMFRDKYGEMVIALDARGKTWRHVVYPYYKIKRREAKAKSAVDWKRYNELSAIVSDEIIANMPYKTLLVDYAEADDIIGVLARDCAANFKDCIIISKDKDFLQLQLGNTFVKQYSARDDEYVTAGDLKRHFFTMLVKGDSDDSIPNIRSADDSFALKIRQKPINDALITKWLTKELPFTDEERINLERNSRLIDLRRTPMKVIEDINKCIDNYVLPPRSNIMTYFMANRLNRLLQKTEDF